VVVTLGAADRQPEPDRGRRVHAIDDVGVVILLGDRAPFEVDHVIAMEPAGDALLRRGVGEQVAGQLFDGELIERLVAIEGIDHPGTPARHVATAVDVVTVRVGEPRGVEPFERQPLAMMGRGK